MQIRSITVIGSSNTDMVVKTSRLPIPGETILGGDFFMNPGGKGANQAVAAARLGGKVKLIAKTGEDIFGREARALFVREGIDIRHVFSDPAYPSGVALIAVDDRAENLIVVAPGANSYLTVEDLARCRDDLVRSEIVLMQLEIPLESVLYAAHTAFEAGIRVVLNPAPARELPDDLLRTLFLITPNETEAELLTGIRVADVISAGKAARKLADRGVGQVIITLGNQGAFYFSGRESRLIPAPRVHAVDTTAAGDVFNGALCVALAEEKSLQEAIAFANRAAALSVTRLGAQASAPYRNEL